MLISTPECKTELEDDQRNLNGVCFVMIDKKLLMVKQSITGKLALPGGTNKQGESAPCTAHRETFEETGIDVLVKQQLSTLGSSTTILYECQPLTTLDLGYSKFLEISKIKLFSYEELKQMDKNLFRFPDTMNKIFAAMENLSN